MSSNLVVDQGVKYVETLLGLTAMEWVLFVVFSIVIFMARNAKKYAESYVDQKAQNLATKEDVKEITRLTKTVEEDIKRSSLVEQKRWDSKKEVYYDLLHKLNELRTATAVVMNLYDPEEDQKYLKRNAKHYEDNKKRQRELLFEIGNVVSVVKLFVNDNAEQALEKLVFGFKTAANLPNENPFAFFKAYAALANETYNIVLKAAKADLYSE